MRLGISGHQDISAEVVGYVKPILIRLINGLRSDLIGVSSLAAGADQLFATIILEHGGLLHVVIPCQDYETTFSAQSDVDCFKLLLHKAHKVETLDYARPSEEAFLNAGRAVVDNSDLLIAVWDGEPAKGKGGTADVVHYARSRGIEVEIVWPPEIVR